MPLRRRPLAYQKQLKIRKWNIVFSFLHGPDKASRYHVVASPPPLLRIPKIIHDLDWYLVGLNNRKCMSVWLTGNCMWVLKRPWSMSQQAPVDCRKRKHRKGCHDGARGQFLVSRQRIDMLTTCVACVELVRWIDDKPSTTLSLIGFRHQNDANNLAQGCQLKSCPLRDLL